MKKKVKKQKKKADYSAKTQKKAPRWYLYSVIFINLIGIGLIILLDDFGQKWFKISIFADVIIGLLWFLFNIGIYVKFKKENYEQKAIFLPTYYIIFYTIFYFISALFTSWGVALSVHLFFWLTIATTIFEVSYAEFLLKDLRNS